MFDQNVPVKQTTNLQEVKGLFKMSKRPFPKIRMSHVHSALQYMNSKYKGVNVQFLTFFQQYFTRDLYTVQIPIPCTFHFPREARYIDLLLYYNFI